MHAARGALVKYARTAQEARLCAMWAERAARSEAARHALSPGLVAARDGDVATLRALAAGGWEAATEVDRHGSTAMMWAAGGGHLGACELLARTLTLILTLTLTLILTLTLTPTLTLTLTRTLSHTLTLTLTRRAARAAGSLGAHAAEEGRAHRHALGGTEWTARGLQP